MRARFTGARNRVEGERARHAVRVIIGRGYAIQNEGRLKDDTGYQIRTVEGPVINLYDTGSITVSGNNRRLFGDVNALRLADTSHGLLILSDSDDAAASSLSDLLAGWDIDHAQDRFGTETWMDNVAMARKQGHHVVALASFTPYSSVLLGQCAEPNVYFGLGLLVARLNREHYTVICRDAVNMPRLRERFGTEVIRFSREMQEIDEPLRRRLHCVGVYPMDSA